MSGDGFGIILGGALLIGAIPVIVYSAAVIGAAFGGLKLAGFLTRKGIEAHHRKTLEAENCSIRMQKMFQDLETSLQRQEQADLRFHEDLAKELEAAANQARETALHAPDIKGFDVKLSQVQKELTAKCRVDARNHREETQRKAHQEAEKTISAMREAMRTEADAVEWAKKDAASQALQRTYAEQTLRDASAALKLLDTLTQNTGDAAYQQQVEVLRTSLQQAENLLAGGSSQAACSAAQQLITQAAVLAVEHEQNVIELDNRRVEVVGRVEALLEEMNQLRTVRFTDCDADGNQLETEEDLNDFSQGKYVQMQDQLRELAFRARKADGQELDAILMELDTQVDGEVHRIMQTSIDLLKTYYERQHIMDCLLEFFSTQDMEFDWAANPGDDRSQELTAHFTNRNDDSTVAVILKDGKNGATGIDMKIYFHNGRPVSPVRMQSLRTQAAQALQAKGMKANIGCEQATQNTQSQDPRYDNETIVRQLPPVTKV